MAKKSAVVDPESATTQVNIADFQRTRDSVRYLVPSSRCLLCLVCLRFAIIIPQLQQQRAHAHDYPTDNTLHHHHNNHPASHHRQHHPSAMSLTTPRDASKHRSLASRQQSHQANPPLCQYNSLPTTTKHSSCPNLFICTNHSTNGY